MKIMARPLLPLDTIVIVVLPQSHPMTTEIHEIALPEYADPSTEGEAFAGDPSVTFDVRSVDVKGSQLRAFGNFGIPDLVDDFLFQGER